MGINFKKVLCIFIITAYIPTLTACRNKGLLESSDATATNSVPASTNGYNVSEEITTLKIFTQYSLPEEKGPFDYAKAEMEKVMPNVKLDLDIQPQDGDAKLRTLAVSGNLPDIFQVTASTRELFKKSGNLLLLDKYVADNKIEDRVQPSYKGLLYDKDGHTYAVPRTAYPTHILYYNKELFSRNKIKIPADYNEFLSSIKAFSALKITPMSVFAKETWPGVMLFEDFITRYEPLGLMKIDEKKATLNDQAYRKAANQLVECVKAGLLSKAAFTMDYDTALNEFESGKSAYFINGAWSLGPIGTKMGDKVDYLDFPLADPSTAAASRYNRPGGGFDGGYSVSANTKYKDIAGKFAVLFALQVANGRVVKAQECYPLTTDGVKPEVPYPPIAQKYVNESCKFKSTTKFPWGLTAEAYVVLGDSVAKLLTGSYPPGEFIKDTDKKLKEVYSK